MVRQVTELDQLLRHTGVEIEPARARNLYPERAHEIRAAHRVNPISLSVFDLLCIRRRDQLPVPVGEQAVHRLIGMGRYRVEVVGKGRRTSRIDREPGQRESVGLPADGGRNRAAAHTQSNRGGTLQVNQIGAVGRNRKKAAEKRLVTCFGYINQPAGLVL